MTAAIRLAALFVILGQVTAPSAPADGGQAALISALRSGTDAEKEIAAAQVLRIDASQRSADLLDAIADAVRAQRAIYDDRGRRYAAGEAVKPLPESELLPDLLTALGQSRDPRVIEPLSLFIANGELVDGPLARFGEQAVPRVAGMAADRSLRSDAVSGALHTLARMLSAQALTPVSTRSRTLFAEIARRRLTERLSDGGAGIIIFAGELAVALGEDDLVSRVRILSRDPAAVKALGLNRASDVSLVQRLLTKYLAR